MVAREELGGAELRPRAEFCRDAVGGDAVEQLDVRVVHAKGTPEGLDHGWGGGLVQADPDRVCVDPSDVAPFLQGIGECLVGSSRYHHCDRVEEGLVGHDVAPRAEAGGEDGGEALDAFSDPAQAVGAVVGGVEGRDDGEQHLGRADVRGGLLPANVLLPGLECQPVGRVACVVHRGAHEAARQRPAVPVRHGHEAGVWSAETHRDPEPLGRTDHHVHVVVAGRRDQAAGEQVRGHSDAHASRPQSVDGGTEVPNPSR